MRKWFVWRFLWGVVWREVGNLTRVVQLIAVTIPFLLAIGFGLFGGEWSKEYWPVWVWASITAGAIFVVIFIGFVRRTYVLEKALEPQVIISEPIEDHLPWNVDTSQKARARHWSIEIENISKATIANCSVKELRFVNRFGRNAPEAGRYFRLKQERGADKSQHTYERFFHLRGIGDKTGIDICMANETKLSAGILMTYATSQTGTTKGLITPDVFPHWLTVRFTSDNIHKPIDKTFKIFVSDDGCLQMETASDEPPPLIWIEPPESDDPVEVSRFDKLASIGDSGPVNPAQE